VRTLTSNKLCGAKKPSRGLFRIANGVTRDEAVFEAKVEGNSTKNVLSQLKSTDQLYDPSALFARDYMPPMILPGHEPFDPLRPKRQRNLKPPAGPFLKRFFRKSPNDMAAMEHRYRGKGIAYTPTKFTSLSEFDHCTKRIVKKRRVAFNGPLQSIANIMDLNVARIRAGKRARSPTKNPMRIKAEPGCSDPVKKEPFWDGLGLPAPTQATKTVVKRERRSSDDLGIPQMHIRSPHSPEPVRVKSEFSPTPPRDRRSDAPSPPSPSLMLPELE
jgi:hypothetical protein